MRLYEIGNEFLALRDIAENDLEFDNETGEIFDNTDVLKQLFEELQSTLSDKMDAAAYIVEELEQTASALKEEATRLAARASNYTKNAAKLKELMREALLASGEAKIKTLKWTFSTRKSESILIDAQVNPDDLPRIYTKLTRTFDKTAIKSALKSGIEIPGASIEVKQNLQIK